MHRRFPDSYNIKCLAASDLKSTPEQIKAHPVPAVTSPNEIQEIFLNFHFSCKFTNPLDQLIRWMIKSKIIHVFISNCFNFNLFQFIAYILIVSVQCVVFWNKHMKYLFKKICFNLIFTVFKSMINTMYISQQRQTYHLLLQWMVMFLYLQVRHLR